MDMLTGEQIAEANLTDWRKLGQDSMPGTWSATSAPAPRFVAEVGEAGDVHDAAGGAT